MSSLIYYVNGALTTKLHSFITDPSYNITLCPCGMSSISTSTWSCDIKALTIQYSSKPAYKVDHSNSCWIYCDSVPLQVDSGPIFKLFESELNSSSTHISQHPTQTISIKGLVYNCSHHKDMVIKIGISLKNTVPTGSFFEVFFNHKVSKKVIQEWMNHYLPTELKQMIFKELSEQLDDTHSEWIHNSHVQYLKLAMLHDLI